jgi:hypothetical protein
VTVFTFAPTKRLGKRALSYLLILKVSYFFQGRGGVKVRNGAYTDIRDGFYFCSNKEIEKKSNFHASTFSIDQPRVLLL